MQMTFGVERIPCHLLSVRSVYIIDIALVGNKVAHTKGRGAFLEAVVPGPLIVPFHKVQREGARRAFRPRERYRRRDVRLSGAASRVSEDETVGEVSFRIVHLFQILVHVGIGYQDGIGRNLRFLLRRVLGLLRLLFLGLFCSPFLRRFRLPYSGGLIACKQNGKEND